VGGGNALTSAAPTLPVESLPFDLGNISAATARPVFSAPDVISDEPLTTPLQQSPALTAGQAKPATATAVTAPTTAVESVFAAWDNGINADAVPVNPVG
jgi:hypothetical protein